MLSSVLMEKRNNTMSLKFGVMLSHTLSEITALFLAAGVIPSRMHVCLFVPIGLLMGQFGVYLSQCELNSWVSGWLNSEP